MEVVAKATTGYLWHFGGTPGLFKIIFVFNLLPQFGITLSNFWSGVVALAMNEGACMAEIVRPGLQAVAAGNARRRERSA